MTTVLAVLVWLLNSLLSLLLEVVPVARQKSFRFHTVVIWTLLLPFMSAGFLRPPACPGAARRMAGCQARLRMQVFLHQLPFLLIFWLALHIRTFETRSSFCKHSCTVFCDTNRYRPLCLLPTAATGHRGLLQLPHRVGAARWSCLR